MNRKLATLRATLMNAILKSGRSTLHWLLYICIYRADQTELITNAPQLDSILLINTLVQSNARGVDAGL